MDRENLVKLKALLDEILGDNEPTDEELDFDDKAIEMYAEMHNLKQAMEELGF